MRARPFPHSEFLSPPVDVGSRREADRLRRLVFPSSSPPLLERRVFLWCGQVSLRVFLPLELFFFVLCPVSSPSRKSRFSVFFFIFSGQGERLASHGPTYFDPCPLLEDSAIGPRIRLVVEMSEAVLLSFFLLVAGGNFDHDHELFRLFPDLLRRRSFFA